MNLRFQKRRSGTMRPSLLTVTTTLVVCSNILGFAPIPLSRPAHADSTALNIWWFGGSERTESIDSSADSCELVAVRIDNTSPNSRRIGGEITVETPLEDVWAILTDYNELSVHVPNLVESRMVPPFSTVGRPGDGQFQCRLYQKGAQKIIGFEFGASVTMDMTERSSENFRQIEFKCLESPFFSEFDGYWRVSERMNDVGEMETVVSYSVDVRPRGPVPVAALEWRIREDVPTNLRAVKHAALTVGYDGVQAEKRLASPARHHAMPASMVPASRRRQTVPRKPVKTRQPPMVTASLATVPNMDWGDDETMAAYLKGGD